MRKRFPFIISVRSLVFAVSMLAILLGLVVYWDTSYRNNEINAVLARIQSADHLVVEWHDRPNRLGHGVVRLGGAEKVRFLDMLRKHLKLENSPNQALGRFSVTVNVLYNSDYIAPERLHLRESVAEHNQGGIHPVVMTILGNEEVTLEEIRELNQVSTPILPSRNTLFLYEFVLR